MSAAISIALVVLPFIPCMVVAAPAHSIDVGSSVVTGLRTREFEGTDVHGLNSTPIFNITGTFSDQLPVAEPVINLTTLDTPSPIPQGDATLAAEGLYSLTGYALST